MERTFINQIRENDMVEGVFWVKEKSMPTTRTGSPYLRVRLSDRTGEMEGRIWDGVEEFADLFEREDFIQIKAQANSYHCKIVIKIIVPAFGCRPVLFGEKTAASIMIAQPAALTPLCGVWPPIISNSWKKVARLRASVPISFSGMKN